MRYLMAQNSDEVRSAKVVILGITSKYLGNFLMLFNINKAFKCRINLLFNHLITFPNRIITLIPFLIRTGYIPFSAVLHRFSE